MSKKENTTPQEDKEKKPSQEPEAPETKPEETAEAAPETYTLTKEQMEKLEDVAKQLASEKDQHLRLAAEYDNYRKRTAREKETLYQDAKTDTISKFLDVYDNLERAVSQEGGEDSPHRKGLEMIFRQLVDILEKMGVTIEDPQGKEFDPEKHEAVMHVDSEELGENIVAQVFQKGFILGDRVIRFAKCQVAN